MKIITLQEAYDILENCAGIIVEDHIITYPSLSRIIDSDESEFLYIQWEDEGVQYSLKFQEGENRKIKIIGSSMFLIDDEGDEQQITVLQTKNLEE